MDAFRYAGLHAEQHTLDPRYPEEALISRCVGEGVRAIVKLTREDWQSQTVSFKIYSRDAGNTNVRFDGTHPTRFAQVYTAKEILEYRSLRPDIAAQLIRSAKEAAVARSGGFYPPTSYGQPPPTPHVAALPASYSYPPQPTPNIAAASAFPPQVPHPQFPPQLPASLDPNIRNQLLAALPAAQAGGASGHAGVPPDLSSLLSQLSGQTGAPVPSSAPPHAAAPTWGQQYAGTPQNAVPTTPQAANPQYDYAAVNHNAAAQNMTATQQQQAKPQQPDMKEVLAQLAQYNR